MFKNISIRWRLTLFTSILIALCCISLSVVLNINAYRMAETIEAATLTTPAISIEDSNTVYEEPQLPMIPVESAKSNYLEYSLIYTFIAVAVGGLLTYYVAGKSLEPVKSLNAQAKNVNFHNLDETLEIPNTNDEIAELTQTFNEMTDKLSVAFITQKRFSVNAAHELRTPLAVLQTKLDVFQKKSDPSIDDYQVLTKSFQKQIYRLRNLVSELLDIANMEDEFYLEKIKVNDLFTDLDNELELSASKSNIDISFISKNEVIFANYDLVFRAIFNVIENAMKYNKENGSIVIEASTNKNHTEIMIRDTGIGIPEDKQSSVFDPFFRVDESRNKEIPGNGLGLSLVKTILEKHGGSIELVNSNSNGSTFRITLPNKK